MSEEEEEEEEESFLHLSQFCFVTTYTHAGNEGGGTEPHSCGRTADIARRNGTQEENDSDADPFTNDFKLLQQGQLPEQISVSRQ